jgi:phage major head subunit gpT-like protein
MPITTANFAKALWPGVRKWYGDAYKEYPTQYTEIFETMTSDKAFEEIVGSSGFGMAAVKPEGSSVAYDTAQQGYLNRFTHLTLGLGFIITKEAFEDDQYRMMGRLRSKALAKSIRITKETIAANILNRAATAGYTYGDGQVLGSASHPLVGGGTFSNLSTADLSEAALEDAVIAMGKWEDDRGLRIAVKPRKLIVPPDNQFEAERILNTDLRVDTANNDTNAIKSLGRVPGGFAVNNYLTDTDSWYLMTDQEGMVHFERRADEFTMDNDFDTDNAKYKATGRYSFGAYDARSIYLSMGA